MNRIGIGSAQFGQKYGINSKEKIKPKEIKKIFKYLYLKNKKCYIDTSPTYGNAETLIGKNLNKKNKFRIITKTISSKSRNINNKFVKNLENSFFLSLKRLKQKKVYGLLVHNVNDLLKKNSNLLYNQLLILKKKKLVNKIGISVYNRKDIQRVLSKYKFDIIQLPCNILDQRLIKDGTLNKLKKQKIELHARSIFLQGLLFSDRKKIQKKFNGIIKNIDLLNNRLNTANISIQEAAISFIKNLKKFNAIIIGIDNFKQLKNIVEISSKKLPFRTYDLFSKDINCVDPRFWKK